MSKQPASKMDTATYQFPDSRSAAAFLAACAGLQVPAVVGGEARQVQASVATWMVRNQIDALAAPLSGLVVDYGFAT